MAFTKKLDQKLVVRIGLLLSENGFYLRLSQPCL